MLVATNLPRSTDMQNLDPTVVIRSARGSDVHALADLARLDSQRPLTGDVLVAEQGGRLVAAIDDPFRPTADLVALLNLRAGRSRAPRRRRELLRVPLPRAA